MSDEPNSLEQSVTAQEQPRKQLKDMSPEERRDYDRTAKQRSRARKKQEQLLVSIPAYEDFELPVAQRHALDEHCQPILAQIAEELPNELEFEDERIITQIAQTLFAQKKGWTQRVRLPDGMLYGGIFIDAVVSDGIHRVHRFPTLLHSATLSGLYRELLNVASKLASQPWFDRQFARELEMELAGKFEVPPAPQIPRAPEPTPPEPPVPSFSQILEQGRNRLLDRLSRIDPNLPPDAWRYLNGN